MKKVMLGLSGGVDSAVAAYLLKEQGYDVVCCFMRNWDAMANNDVLGNPTLNDSMCPQEKDYQDAKRVAEELDLPFLRILGQCLYLFFRRIQKRKNSKSRYFL